MNTRPNKQTGVGVIEVLISLVILSVGLISVASLHSRMIGQSNENKAKAEAMVIAQQRLEEMRNYSGAVTELAEFNDLYQNISNGNKTEIQGSNAIFERSESIADGNDVKELTVAVTWTDGNGESNSVSLDSAIGWTPPRSSGDVASEAADPLVASATGRARLGEGILSDYPNATHVEQNIDLTHIYNTNDGNLRLAINDDVKTIVLTLEDACQINATRGSDFTECTDFVKISGRVFIDYATQRSLTPGEIYVRASDAAFCQRYYYENGEAVLVTADTTTAQTTTPNGDYGYFHYTCYLGGGWHGNIGILLESGISQSDKICQGDPTSNNDWEQPEIAARRVYRGMSYKVAAVEYNEHNELVIDTYYTIGIADAAQLPYDGSNVEGHDFVVASLSASDTEGEKCISEGIMTRDDALDGTAVPGSLFANNPTDFYCLNSEDKLLVDLENNPGFDIEATCPFDPSDPPSLRHQIAGTVQLRSALDNVEEILSSMFVNTSDGLGNCYTVTPSTLSTDTYSLPYVCDVYDWGNGWNGYIQVNTDFSEVSCSPYREYFSTITGDTTATGHECQSGSITTVSGIVSGAGNRQIESVTTSDTEGLCELAADGLSYSCYSGLLPIDTNWSGTLYFIASNSAKICINSPTITSGGVSIGISGNTARVNFYEVAMSDIDLPISIVSKNSTCP